MYKFLFTLESSSGLYRDDKLYIDNVHINLVCTLL